MLLNIVKLAAMRGQFYYVIALDKEKLMADFWEKYTTLLWEIFYLVESNVNFGVPTALLGFPCPKCEGFQ